MSELNDLLTTRELQRWRLILGEAAETTLCADESPNDFGKNH